MTAFATDFFICHASSDGAEPAREIVRELEARDVRCWIAPRNIPLGMTWPRAIVSGLESSRAMLLVVSRDANLSEEIEKEVTLAAHLHKIIFPVRVQDVPLSGTLLYQVQTRQWRDFFADRTAVIDEIATQIKSMREGVAAAPAPPPEPIRPPPTAPREAVPQKTSVGRRAVLTGAAAVSAAAVGVGFVGRGYLSDYFQHTSASRDLPPKADPPPALQPAPAQPPPRPTGTRYAVVVGNGTYKEVPPLANPRNDAEDVATALRDVGFTTALKVDADRAGMNGLLRDLHAQAQIVDWAVVYYSGHAFTADGVNYIIPIDAKLETMKDVLDEAITLDSIVDALKDAPVRSASWSSTPAATIPSRPGSRKARSARPHVAPAAPKPQVSNAPGDVRRSRPIGGLRRSSLRGRASSV